MERNYDIGEQLGNLSVFACKGRPFGGPRYGELSDFDWKKVHLFVLKNCEEIEKFRSEHIAELIAESGISVEQRHDLHFPKWFRKRVEQLHSEGLANDELISLANGPDTDGRAWKTCCGQSEISSSHGDSNVHSHEEIVNSTSTNPEDWEYLCTYFSSEEYQVENGGVVGPIELYKLTRYKCEKDSENGCWVSAVAKENYEKMMELRIERQAAGESLVDEEQICAEVLGYKSGYIRGRGAGPKPKTSFSKSKAIEKS
ncbi:UNVERIFIED_CONTAM: hypothetical protein Scaly_2439600 [Sesamum calycinum]|uniref:Uncharacterized protein n=1 Tax=Sesamum calycinum TaxID=2727403 RepID=A0AAW2LZY7_9LAMI